MAVYKWYILEGHAQQICAYGVEIAATSYAVVGHLDSGLDIPAYT